MNYPNGYILFTPIADNSSIVRLFISITTGTVAPVRQHKPIMRIKAKRKHVDYGSDSDMHVIDDPLADSSSELVRENMSHTSTVPENCDVLEVLKLVRELTEASKAQTQLLEQQAIELRSVKAQLINVTSELQKVKVVLRGVHAPEPVAIQSAAQQKIQELLPIKSYADLMKFESSLDREEFKIFLSKIGGKTVSKMVSNIVSEIYTPELQVATTWKGKRAADGTWAKDPLGVASTPHIIMSVIQAAFPKNTNDEVMRNLQSHLQHATDRVRKIQK